VASPRRSSDGALHQYRRVHVGTT